jgi:hypothetical protein
MYRKIFFLYCYYIQMNINLFNRDYEYGINNENQLFEKLTRKFGKIKKSEDKMALFDYYGENIFLELKTRRNTKNKYETTMIGKNKINWAQKKIKENPETKIYFIFCFTDGIYYLEYLNNENINFNLGGRNDRGYNEINEYAYIPVNLLTELK